MIRSRMSMCSAVSRCTQPQPGLTVTQNVDFLGGSLYLESDLEYMRNFGAMKGNQFSSVPVRLGYRQNLIGYNAFRWGEAY